MSLIRPSLRRSLILRLADSTCDTLALCPNSVMAASCAVIGCWAKIHSKRARCDRVENRVTNWCLLPLSVDVSGSPNLDWYTSTVPAPWHCGQVIMCPSFCRVFRVSTHSAVQRTCREIAPAVGQRLLGVGGGPWLCPAPAVQLGFVCHDFACDQVPQWVVQHFCADACHLEHGQVNVVDL